MTLSHEKTIEQKYQVLSEVEHVRKRLGVYAGSSTEHIAQEYVFDGRGMVIEKLSYIPAALKCINEILDNAIDEHKRDPKKLNKISVTVNENTGEIIIEDNGGTPVVKHSEFDMYVPEIIFGMLRSGSNYDDSEDQQVIGTNGLGSKLTNILSTSFIVETADGINKFKQEFKNGMREKSDPKVVPIKKNYTTIQFTLDWDFFNTSLNADLINKIQMAVINAAGNNPKCKFLFNDEQIKIKSFKDYIDLYTTDYIYEETDDWKVGVAPAELQGFEQISFVNSVNTFSGGTHIDYVMNQITNEVRLLIKKKHKIEVKPSDIKNQMRLFLSCNVNRPTFNSQTKEFMTSEPKIYHTEWKCSNSFIKKIMESEVVQSILDWAAAKEEANKRADLRKLNKNADKMNPKKVAKFVDATSKIRSDCKLFLAEGDSAASSIKNARDPQTMGVFPLRGKPINAYEVDIKRLMQNEEFKNILAITGLQIGEKVEKVDQLRFGSIVISTDSDLDGFSIRGLLIAMFNRFWPELFDLGIVKILETPIVKVFHKKKEISFYDLKEFEKWKILNINEKYTIKYYKGLGTATTKEFKEYLSEESLIKNLKTVLKETTSDNTLEMLFSKSKADDRKNWLNLTE